MKISSRNSIQNKRWLVAALVVTLIGAVTAYFFLNPAIPSGPSTNEKATGEAIKKNSLQPTSDNNDTPRGNGSDPLPDPTPSEDGKPTVGMDITSLSQDQNTLRIRVIIKTISNSGICKLSMKHSSGIVYESSTEAQALASSTTCKGFDISKDTLRDGSWDATVTYENVSVQSQTTKVIEIE